MAACNVDFDNAVKYALNLLKSSDLVLKREQKEVLHAVCVEKRDCAFFQRDLENLKFFSSIRLLSTTSPKSTTAVFWLSPL